MIASIVRAPLWLCCALAGASLAASPGNEKVTAPRTAQVQQGMDRYGAACAACHGATFEGGDHAPALRGEGFTANWQSKPQRALYSRIISTMPMDDPGSLPPADALAITLAVLEANGVHQDSPVASPDELNTRPYLGK